MRDENYAVSNFEPGGDYSKILRSKRGRRIENLNGTAVWLIGTDVVAGGKNRRTLMDYLG